MDSSVQLPSQIMNLTTMHKLVYLWVKENPGKHSSRSLSASLGGDVQSALRDLKQAGVLEILSAPAGRRAGVYRVVVDTQPLNNH